MSEKPTADLHKRVGSGAAIRRCQYQHIREGQGRFMATRRPWMDLENTAAIFAAAAKEAQRVAATAESIQSVDFGSGVEPGSRRDRVVRASRIEIKIDRLTQESGDISQKQLDFLFLLFLWTAFV